ITPPDSNHPKQECCMIASGSFGNNSLPQLMSVGSVGQHDDTRPLHRITKRERFVGTVVAPVPEASAALFSLEPDTQSPRNRAVDLLLSSQHFTPRRLREAAGARRR